jgi:hypothetical protein
MIMPADRPELASPKNMRGDSDDHQRRAETAAAFKKAPPPQLGEAFTQVWANDFTTWNRLPGGGIIQFDLNQLTLSDFRAMKDHYQVNASLGVLMFLMHQLDWKIVSDNPKIAKACEENMREVWTRLVRALSQAFWAGYSPNILQWENDTAGRAVKLSKIKDMIPELCDINWKDVEGYAPPGHVKPKIKVYDGIKQYGLGWPIPAENTLWYTLLKENENPYGRKLLRPAFTPWYFSILIHMFANRYFERFGEPLPVGRAPMDNIKLPDGTQTTGLNVMSQILQNLRNRATVVLPDDRTVRGTEAEYDYQIEYLESQMRGADFERYLMRLDEEISLALFTPLLVLRTADVGSYNLGTMHWNVFQQMLNSLAGDWAEYIDRYILGPMVNFNFGPTAKRAKIKFRKLGDDKMQLVLTLLQALISANKAELNLEQLGEIAGLDIKEVEELQAEDDVPPAPDPGGDPSSGGTGGDPEGTSSGKGKSSNRRADVSAVRANIQARVGAQLARARSAGDASVRPDLGFRRQLLDALGSGVTDSDLGRVLHRSQAYLAEGYEAGLDRLEEQFDAFFADQLERLGDAS